jgi:hypothetical protein
VFSAASKEKKVDSLPQSVGVAEAMTNREGLAVTVVRLLGSSDE